MKLRLKRTHPHNRMRLGRHNVTSQLQEFELDDGEQKELKTAGGQHWFTAEEREVAPVKKSGKKEKKEKKK
jgi:hypothetical protein